MANDDLLGSSGVKALGIVVLLAYGCSGGDPSASDDPWMGDGGTAGLAGGQATVTPQGGTAGQVPLGPGTGGEMAIGTGGTLGEGGSGEGGFGGAPDAAGGMAAGGAPEMGGTSGIGGSSMGGGSGVLDGCDVTAVPDGIRSVYRLPAFYQKYADASGIPVATSSLVSDRAITLACQLVKEMVSLRDDVRQSLIRTGMRFTLIAASEQLSSIPEVNARFGTSLNQRARGLGSLIPTICAEENILCQRERDRWRGENICVHEYAHTIMTYGLERVDPTFRSRLDAAYRAAQAAGTFANTYAISTIGEFWAEGVQNWYNSNLEAIPANGVHNWVNTREELKQASPALHDLISETYPEDIQFDDCYAVQ